MIIFQKTADIADFLAKRKKSGAIIGFIPTMGALHEGHISLIKYSKKTSELTVCSIFVNPTQFNDRKDFEKYPIIIEQDIDTLEKNNCDILFLPSVNEIYPDNITKSFTYQLGYLETILEGKFRPGHFQGVCKVVHRLLNIVPADNLYLGQKDYQQCCVIKKMTTLVGINTHIFVCSTVRENDGLAMSSRNMLLNTDERKKAVLISKTLSAIKKQINPGDLATIKKDAIHNLTTNGFRVDYVEIAHTDTLQIVEKWDGKAPLVILTAASLNKVRLIDNMLLQN